MSFFKGMDVSMLRELEEHGASYCLNGHKADLFDILKKCGVNMIRLRIWVDPYDTSGSPYGGGCNDLQTTAELAERIINSGMSYMLDFHYSDFWADPAKQIKPKAWMKLSGKELETAVYLHTADTLKYLKNRNLMPQMIQVGNEITNGLLWPDGHVSNLQAMVAFLKSGIKGAREICPEAKIVMHLDFGTDCELYTAWFDSIQPYAVDFDVIGMSYYPHWNGSIDRLLKNMNEVSRRYNKDVLVAETSIGYTTDTLGCNGVVFSKEQEKATGYPATQDGQSDFLRDLYAAVRSVQGGHGIGVFYWEPAWLPIPDCTWANQNGRIYMNDKAEAGNTMANQALFDIDGNANKALLNLREM